MEVTNYKLCHSIITMYQSALWKIQLIFKTFFNFIGANVEWLPKVGEESKKKLIKTRLLEYIFMAEIWFAITLHENCDQMNQIFFLVHSWNGTKQCNVVIWHSSQFSRVTHKFSNDQTHCNGVFYFHLFLQQTVFL